MDKQLKAYVVREPDEGHCRIVFATRNVVARREGAAELNIEFEEVESCTRAPWADQYAPGPVPVQAMIEAGWWYECECGCGRRIDNGEGQHNIDADGDDGELNPMDPVYFDHGVYWNQKCIDAEIEYRRQQEEAKARDKAEVESAVLAKFPFATEITDHRSYAMVDGKADYKALQAQFRFPGGRWTANWIVGSDRIQVQSEDIDAWLALHPEPEAARA